MNKLAKHNKTGFTLIEIVIALLVLSIGLLGMLSLFPVGFDAAGRAGNIITATFLAQEEIEDVKRVGYDGIIASPYITKAPFSAPSYQNFEREVTWSSLAGDLKQVNVIVYWPAGATTNQKSVSLTTYISKL